MLTSPDLSTWTIAWGALATFVLIRHWRRGWGVGLMLTYVFCFAALHWLATLLHLLPWFETLRGDMTAEGLRQSTFAMAGLALGAEFVARSPGRLDVGAFAEPLDSPVVRQLINLYLVVGVVLYAIALTGGRLPFISAIVSTGSTLVAVSVGLKCWYAWKQKRRLALWLWLGLTVAFPLISVLTQGFLGYGFVAALIVFSFVVSVQPARGWNLIAAALLIFVGLSIYVTYMRDRSDIRDVVWGGEGVGTRVAQLQNTFRDAEWFDPWNREHLERVDRRLNQNHLLGSAVAFIGEGNVPHAKGSTLTEAVVALVPRALWPNKPEVAGSGDLVATYTGIRFAVGTSVGVGQALELFVNFGTVGVTVGFMVLGWLLAGIDRRASTYLRSGDLGRFMLWYMPGLSLLQIGGSIAEVTATAGASAVLVVLVNRLRKPDEPAAVTTVVLPSASASTRREVVS